MTRKDFKIVAAALAKARMRAPHKQTVDITIKQVSDELAQSYMNFNTDQFLKACDYET